MRARSNFALGLTLSILALGCGGSSDAGGDGEPSLDAGPTDSGAGGVDAGGDGERLDTASTDATTSDGAADTAIGSDAPGPDGATDAAPAGDYASKGPFAVSKTDATVSGNAVHVLWPATPAGTLRSAVVFAHGFQLATTSYDLLLTHLASWGYVVVSVEYPGSLFSIDHRAPRDALIKAKDALVAGSIAGIPKVDPARIAASGHSLGGKASVMAVLADKAFVAALAIDPVDGNPTPGGTVDDAHPKLIPTETAKLTVPMGYFGATQSRCVKSAFGPACAPEGADAAAFFAATPASIPHPLWTVFDFGHMQFLDGACGFTCSACTDGKGDVAARHAAIQGIAVAFLQRHVDGVTTAQSWLDGAKRDAYVTAGVLWDGAVAKPACL